jgi:hypothetical protein
MARFEIVIDDEDREHVTARPWTAGLWEEGAAGKTGDLLVAGVGTTPLEALTDLLNTARAEAGDALAALEGGDGGAPYHCRACLRVEVVCSADPCDAVLEGRGETRCDECGEPVPNEEPATANHFHLTSCSLYENGG